MDCPTEAVDDLLEQNLLKSYDKEAVAKLLDKRVRSAQPQWEREDEGPVSKRPKTFEGIYEEKEYLVSKVEMLEAQLRTEKSYRTHYEAKSSNQSRNLKKLEDLLRNQKMQLKSANQQSSNSKFEQMKSKLLVRIGDIEKDTIEIKAGVIAELKNISDFKKPLENVSKLVEFLQTELEVRDIKIEEFDKLLLVEKDKTVLGTENKLASGISTSCLADMSKISDSIKNMDDSNSVLAKSVEVLDETLEKLKFELEEKTRTIVRLTEDLDKLSNKNQKVVLKKEKLGDEYDELERYLTKTEMKLEKKKSKIEKMTLENESSQYEVESLKDLNENLMEQINVLKEESVLLKEKIAQKEVKLLRTECKLKLSKEELKMEVLDSFKLSEENMINKLTKKDNEAIVMRREIESTNLKVNNLLQANHKLELEVENLKLENYTTVRNQKVEMKKLRKIQEYTVQELSNTIKLMKIQATKLEENSNEVQGNDIDVENNESSELARDNVANVEEGIREEVNEESKMKEIQSVADLTAHVHDKAHAPELDGVTRKLEDLAEGSKEDVELPLDTSENVINESVTEIDSKASSEFVNKELSEGGTLQLEKPLESVGNQNAEDGISIVSG